MLISMADELAQKTLTYWQVSQCWNGRSTREIETGTAIHLMGDTAYNVNPARPLVRRSLNLLQEIIDDTPRKSGATADLLPMPQIETRK